MKKILIPVLLVCIAFAGCNSNQKKEKEKDALADINKLVSEHPGLNAGVGTYSITAPTGWEKMDTVMSGVTFTFIKSPLEGKNDRFRENINVTTENAKGYDLEAYVASNLKSMNAQMPGFVMGDKGETTIGGMPARWFVYNMSYSGYDLKNTVYMIVKNETGYVLTCSSLGSTFDKFQADFKTCVYSFIIKE
jgi:hypothetical protein